ncbi:MAG: DUF2085 domain-containing protein, partial [Anaerolineaceae bacterium]|nr:DUF2085 domain-containing protein [Anaerolineaceae bacterium]
MTASEDRNLVNNEEESLSKRLSVWLRKHYLAIINILLAFYVGLPILAPILMKTGQEHLADRIYKLYRPLCHQLAYRSFFLFGEQAYYPLEIAEIEGVKSFEQVTGLAAGDTDVASAFVGNEQLGYKIALCQRDLAIYGSLLLFGLVFALSGRKMKALPWLAWLLLALLPMGLDGVSQLLGNMNISALSWISLRESTPFLRVLTGFMFGWFTAWFGIPSIDEIVNEKKT